MDNSQLIFATYSIMVKRFFWIWLAVLVLMNVLPIGNAFERKLLTQVFVLRFDYLVHILSFTIPGGIYCLSVWKKQTMFRRHAPLIIASIVFSIAIILEIIQLWIPYRSFNIWDMIANIIGAMLSMIIVAASRLMLLPKRLQNDAI